MYDNNKRNKEYNMLQNRTGKKSVDLCIFPLIYRFDIFNVSVHVYFSQLIVSTRYCTGAERNTYIGKDVTLECCLN